ADGHRRFGAITSQGVETRASSAAQHETEDFIASHAGILSLLKSGEQIRLLLAGTRGGKNPHEVFLLESAGLVELEEGRPVLLGVVRLDGLPLGVGGLRGIDRGGDFGTTR